MTSLHVKTFSLPRSLEKAPFRRGSTSFLALSRSLSSENH